MLLVYDNLELSPYSLPTIDVGLFYIGYNISLIHFNVFESGDSQSYDHLRLLDHLYSSRFLKGKERILLYHKFGAAASSRSSDWLMKVL